MTITHPRISKKTPAETSCNGPSQSSSVLLYILKLQLNYNETEYQSIEINLRW